MKIEQNFWKIFKKSKGQSVIEYSIIAVVLILSFLFAATAMSPILRANMEVTEKGFSTVSPINN